MNTKDPLSNKKQLLNDLTSLKDALDEDDDNVPLLLDDDGDIPILEDDDNIPLLEDDDDIPVLGPDTQALKAANKTSLEAAMRQLESMELAPARKSTRPSIATSPKPSLEEKIRSNAEPPKFNDPLTKARENPFLNNNQKIQLEQSRRLQEESQRMAEIATLTKQGLRNPTPPAPPAAEPIEFTNNQFLTASASGAKNNAAPMPPSAQTEKMEDKKPSFLSDEDGLGEIIFPEDDDTPEIKAPEIKAIADKRPAIDLKAQKRQNQEVDIIIDEIVDEYLVVLEAALRKKLKEKLPNIFK